MTPQFNFTPEQVEHHLREWGEELELTETQIGVLILCSGKEDLTDQQIADKIGVMKYEVRKALTHLREALGASKKSEIYFKSYQRLQAVAEREGAE
ncbi:hypothetical protein JJB07_14730 [Tumebacillus sp. ITR2]|uniref:HTH luxR-type domain-containing protein n=1 Tax=Tumebacillus amylolyticus TaxID=2801339 RepID=A0ABS1JC88_9BACL|nr:hypothetical protein [Tumebacillus amylolyticus]MBL0387894.1 hypothetical protein [Tumebacillus amylolyticus]